MERRVLTRWLVLSGLLVAAFIGTVITLNLTLYSASGFVNSYLQALARRDVDGALAMPGVRLTGTGSTALVSPGALGDLGGIRFLRDTDDGAGRHTVVYGYSFSGLTGTSSFAVEHTGSRLGLFSAWRFVTSPEGTLRLTPLHDDDFEANSVSLVSKGGANVAESYRVLTPASLELSHTSTYLAAPKTRVLVTVAGSTVDASVDIQANESFIREVQQELDKYLAGCVTQQVLLPTECPMGTQITDRIQDAPVWAMVTFPKVTIAPGPEAGSWVIPDTKGTAHVTVKVKSIFDGSLSTFDQDVAFSVRYVITFQADGSPLITAQY